MANVLRAAVNVVRRRARARRAATFLRLFRIGEDTRILDLGSADGSHIAAVLKDTLVRTANVYIADIDQVAVERGADRYGFSPVVIQEDGTLPFADQYFDIVFSSSVIEHVTLAKDAVWTMTSTETFRERSLERQRRFAAEIRRLGAGYFVQTPNKWFPIESHTLLPFVGWLPRRVLVPTVRLSNRYWIKSTRPDWHLLTAGQLAQLFPESTILAERFLGLTKSLMAYKQLPR